MSSAFVPYKFAVRVEIIFSSTSMFDWKKPWTLNVICFPAMHTVQSLCGVWTVPWKRAITLCLPFLARDSVSSSLGGSCAMTILGSPSLTETILSDANTWTRPFGLDAIGVDLSQLLTSGTAHGQ